MTWHSKATCYCLAPHKPEGHRHRTRPPRGVCWMWICDCRWSNCAKSWWLEVACNLRVQAMIVYMCCLVCCCCCYSMLHVSASGCVRRLCMQMWGQVSGRRALLRLATTCAWGLIAISYRTRGSCTALASPCASNRCHCCLEEFHAAAGCGSTFVCCIASDTHAQSCTEVPTCALASCAADIHEPGHLKANTLGPTWG